MHKPLTLLFLLFAIILCLIVSSDVATQSNVENEDEGVISVDFDKTKATLACPGVRSRTGSCDEDDRQIRILTVSKDAEKNGWTYYYLVSGGKIIGDGANIVWDFTGARPGDYTITVGVGKDGILKGNTISKSVIAESCECDPPCNCPSISMSGPTAFAKRGDSLIFTARLTGGNHDRAVVNWTVSDGEIIKIIQKADESQILVKISAKPKQKQITATVEVSGLCADCQNTASATVQVFKL